VRVTGLPARRAEHGDGLGDLGQSAETVHELGLNTHDAPGIRVQPIHAGLLAQEALVRGGFLLASQLAAA